MRTRMSAWIGAVVIAIPLSAGVSSAQAVRDDTQTLEARRAGSAKERRDAVEVIRKIPVADRGPLMLTALLDELDRQRRRLEDRQFALSTGRPLPPSEEDAEYLFSALDVVAQHKDDSTIIRPLLPFIGTGNRVINTLAGFGNLAAAEVLAIAAFGLSPDHHVDSALLVLQRMLERPGDYPVSGPTRNAILKVARTVLEERRHPRLS